MPRDELYRIRVDRKELDHLITVLLRRYTGLFSDFAAIDEDELAHLSGYTVAVCMNFLRNCGSCTSSATFRAEEVRC